MTLRACLGTLVGAALAGSLLIVAAPAAAKPCHQHNGNGNSEISQYLENVPGPCGDQGIGGNGSGNQGTSSGSGSGSSATGLPSGTISQLQSSGPAGAQAASFAKQTDPSGTNGGSDNSGSATTADEASDSGGGGSLLSALGHMVTGNQASAEDSGQGLGLLLPTLLGVVLLGGLAVLTLRRRGTG